LNQIQLEEMLKAFLLEDIGSKDVTRQSIFPPGQIGKAEFLVKEDGVIAGLDLIRSVYRLLDETIVVDVQVKDGAIVSEGDVIAQAKGPVRHLLTGERLILNLMQRLSGIATLTRRSVKSLNDSTIHICDTRKTTPGLRVLEKYAVRIGGGKNHRFGLDDGDMIKDNHIGVAGSIEAAVAKVREETGHMMQVEVETETEADVIAAVKAGADIIMFDNCSPSEVKERVSLVPDHIVTEASGGITLETLHEYAGTGVDYISLGYLTHSAKALDISLNVSISE